MKHFSNLFVFSATLRSPVVGQQRSKSLCFVTTFTTCRLSQSSVGLSQFAQYLNLTSRNCGTEDKCEFKFSVYSMLASPQHTSCFFFWYFLCDEHKASRSHLHFLWSADMMYSFNCSCPPNVGSTNNWIIQKISAFCRMCVYSSFTFIVVLYLFVSLLFLRPGRSSVMYLSNLEIVYSQTQLCHTGT